MYTNFYTSLNIPLPKSLRCILFTIAILKNNILIITLISGGVFFFYIRKYKIKVLNNIYNFLFSSSLSDVLWLTGILIKSGLSLKESLKVIADSKENSFCAEFSEFIRALSCKGRFSQLFNSYFKLTNYQKEILVNAEQTGGLADAFMAIASDIRVVRLERLKRTLSIIQPFLLCVAGVVVFLFVYLAFIPVLASLKNII